ncbi:LuxR C-terminal-related transcriptional regulator [Amnibacterium sp.]|uniref:LuxR C-terminal-related transcriptional regulator n=1 Tax=Amnibacterium sp. TaxID=1872496 RepID=UPI00260D170E|nr:LuxR C-terminal-related transcriptional regulator [Amnibacterium sp.]MCU1473689.1 ATP-dependent transcriptional regulator, MalT-like, LuxR family [Amnibacterium sp.]
MSGQLLESKLRLPAPHRDLVPRARLTERLDRGLDSRLTLLSAPAGFGKTTLLAAWLRAGSGRAPDARWVAWLSLDHDDDEPVQFWAAVIAALAVITPDFGSREAELLRGSQPPPLRAVLTGLLNDLATVDRDVLLVLDDYHAIESLEIHESMAFLVDHLPPRIHVVIATRADPALPLARLRARGELTELRGADLRFTSVEVSAYLTQAMGLTMAAELTAALTGRTEGWIAALQLAVLSMQGRDDVAGFVRAFSGNDRYVVDYLVEEVLQNQPEAVRTFLLETSVLGRMTGPLCDAVTEVSGGAATLETLERANLFLVPLDDARRAYRYHQLFADVLQARLLDERPERIPGLHRRASEWYARHDDSTAAITHALAAGDPGPAADLIERAIPALRGDRRESTLRIWLERLPADLVRVRPVLSVGYAGALIAIGQVDGVEPRLRDAERYLHGGQDVATPSEEAPARAPVVVDREEFARLPAAIAVYRAGLALTLGDTARTVAQATRALELAQPDDHVRRGAAAALLGLSAWGDGNLETAYEAYVECSSNLLRAGYVADVLGCATTLADIRITQGRLHEAMHVYERALQLASARAVPVTRGTPDLHVGLSSIHAERGDLRRADEHLRRAREAGEHAGMPRYRYRSLVTEAFIREGEGDVVGALALLDAAEQDYVADFAPDVRPIASARVRLWLRLGRVDDALVWAREQHLSPDDDLDYLHEYDHVTLARCLLAQQQRAPDASSAALELLHRLLAAAESGGRTGTVIEVLILLAVARRSSGDVPGAVLALDRALSLAEPEGYFRLFADEGSSLEALLRLAARRTAPRTVQRLLRSISRADGNPVRPGSNDPMEQLSDREREVLRLLKTDLSGPEIARRLVVSLNTVRTHTKNIYAKLGVTSRRAAVLLAGEPERAQSRTNAPPRSF